MTESEVNELISRIHAGERPMDELWRIRSAPIINREDESALESLSDLWSLAFHIEGLFPKLEAAKAIVDVAWEGNFTYPVLTNDGLIYDDLSMDERSQLFGYIADRIREDRVSAAGAVLAEFADELMGEGPQV